MSADNVDVADEIDETATIKGLLLHDPAAVAAISGAWVIDVGQGDCIGLLNENDEIFCYIDYGGYNYHPDKGKRGVNPSASRMPAELNGDPVSVILTHWDQDHCWSADQKNTEAQDCYWVVPRQYVSPSVARLAAKLTNAQRWPESIGSKAVSVSIGSKHTVTIRKCEPFDEYSVNADRNTTGLAVSVVRTKDDGSREVMLFPGDCSFDRIPNWESHLPLIGLVAYHHGSAKDWIAGVTDVAVQRWTADSMLTYSVGFNSSGQNCYGHPVKSNYDPDWNTNSRITADVRGTAETGVAMRWS
ncbi:ComEC/Rec2 family competence protein [Lentisalinibacter salinarum]|uniref:hypothetical protein n=1 Tax=Lentisalinibacter salinarum TaxID=2992239 RepID=UPI00386A4570